MNRSDAQAAVYEVVKRSKFPLMPNEVRILLPDLTRTEVVDAILFHTARDIFDLTEDRRVAFNETRLDRQRSA